MRIRRTVINRGLCLICLAIGLALLWAMFASTPDMLSPHPVWAWRSAFESMEQRFRRHEPVTRWMFSVDRSVIRISHLRMEMLDPEYEPERAAASLNVNAVVLASQHRQEASLIFPGMISAAGTGNAFRNSMWTLRIPAWIIAVPLLIPPTVMFWSILAALWRRMHYRKGYCMVCGYDLRATPDRCPECGTPVAAAATDQVDVDPEQA